MRKIILHLAVIVFATLNCVAQPGTLDNTFGTGGIVSTAIGNFNSSAGISTAIDSNNKIVVAGYSYDGTNYNFALDRYNSDGTLDNAFGTGGKVTTGIGNYSSFCFSVAIQSDGKIVAAGCSYNGANDIFALVRYNSDGTLDSSFGSAGKDTISGGIGFDQIIYSVALQNDGKIVLAGNAESQGYYQGYDVLIRYNNDGALDSTFGIGGFVVTGFGGIDDAFKSVAIQSNGKIVAAGYTADTSGDYNFAVFRFNSNGSFDTTGFASPYGASTLGFGSNIYSFCQSVAVQSDGKIVMAGTTSPDGGTHYSLALARMDSDGISLDTPFGSTGKIITTADVNNNLSSVKIQSDGKILVAGSGNDGVMGAGNVFTLVRYNSDGTLDNTFGAGADGEVLTAIGATGGANSMAIQSDGKIIVAGADSANGSWDFAVARYNGDVITGIKETGTQHFAAEAYPNPATNQLTIRTSSFHNAAVTVSIMNVLGQMTSLPTSLYLERGVASIDVSGLSSGMYFLQMKSESGSVVKKFVKE